MDFCTLDPPIFTSVQCALHNCFYSLNEISIPDLQHSSNCLNSMRLVLNLGGPGGGVASSMVACIMPITLAITTKEMKIPFQSLDFVGIETNSCIIKIDC